MVNRKKLVKEINSLRTNLLRRVSNVERLGLANVYTNEFRALDLSARGKTNEELVSLRRTLKRIKNQSSTTVRGAKLLYEVGDIIQGTLNLPPKLRKDVQKYLDRAYEMYGMFRDKRYRYKVRDKINKWVAEGRSEEYIMNQLSHIADKIQEGDDWDEWEFIEDEDVIIFN